MTALQLLSICGSIVFLVVVVDLIRRGHLKEKYSVLWIAATIAILILSMWRELLHKLAGVLGVNYPPSLLFLVALTFVMMIQLHYSVVISKLSDKNKVLAQELALLKAEIRDGVKGASSEPSGRDNKGS